MCACSEQRLSVLGFQVGGKRRWLLGAVLPTAYTKVFPMEISCSFIYTNRTDSAEFGIVAIHQDVDFPRSHSFSARFESRHMCSHRGLNLARTSLPYLSPELIGVACRNGLQKCLLSCRRRRVRARGQADSANYSCTAKLIPICVAAYKSTAPTMAVTQHHYICIFPYPQLDCFFSTF